MKTMKNKLILFSLLIIFSVFCLQIVLNPYLHQREVTKIVKIILKHWKNGDLPEAFVYWEDLRRAPPIYDLVSSTLIEKTFHLKDTPPYAQIVVKLEFPEGNVIPSGKEWVFELTYTKSGWKVKNFHPFP